jgi:hypothetical protein
MDTENSTVDNVKASLDMTEKGRIKSTLDNCMIVMRRDPFLKGAICKNEMTGRVDIVKNLGWNKAGLYLRIWTSIRFSGTLSEFTSCLARET